MPLYVLTIFLSAFLLFLVQPMIGKYILPWFGGASSVWTTCMLFFQTLLLVGYAGAHAMHERLTPRRQVAVFLGLILLACVFLPTIPDEAWRPDDVAAPTVRILLLLLATVGLPYLALAATGPLLQAWFVRTHPGRSPYGLYAFSNAGSFLALLGYPFLVEPWLTRLGQGWLWAGGFVLYGLFVGAVGAGLWRAHAKGALVRMNLAEADDDDHETPPTFGRRVMWLLLAACGSVMLLAATNQITQDIAAVPFLWVLPLALYLLTFVVTFAGERWYRRAVFAPLLIAATAWQAYLVYNGVVSSLLHQIVGSATVLVAVCMVCHGELYRLRPHACRLTGFYLTISLGGALGGGFVAVVAPVIFDGLYEFPLATIACGMLLLTAARFDPPTPSHRRAVRATSLGGLAVGVVAGAVALVWCVRLDQSRAIELSRNFYGVLGVHADDRELGGPPLARELVHGRIMHGYQFLAERDRVEPTSYYGPDSGVSLAVKNHRRGEPRRIGVVGLGIGTIVALAEARDHVRFYEINPDVERLAREFFWYLEEARPSTEVVLGDARLVLEREDPQAFDILILDAFTGDAVPIHLLTREAFAIYDRHLRDDGAIIVNISNRHVDLRPVVWGVAEAMDFDVALVENDADEGFGWVEATWMILTRDATLFEHRRVADRITPSDPARRRTIEWTDEYANLLDVLR